MARTYAVGEALLDIIFKDGQPLAANPGGAMLNTAVSLGRAGADVAMISELTDDHAGRMISRFLSSNGVGLERLTVYKGKGKTALSIAEINDEGEAGYTFYKDYPEKRELSAEINFRKGDQLIFGSLYSLSGPIREDVKKIVKNAGECGATVIYDPNIRTNHAKQVPQIYPWIIENISLADIVRASDEDLRNIFSTDDEKVWRSEVLARCKTLIVTRGKKGVDLITGKLTGHYPSRNVNVQSTIGAGDNFNAGMLFKLSQINKRVEEVSANEWDEIIGMGIAFASDCCAHLENYISEDFARTVRD